MRALSISCAFVALATLAGTASAQAPASPATKTDEDRAFALFAEARGLLATDPQTACAKFTEAHALSPLATGILLNVGDCEVRFGRFASAQETFARVRVIAIDKNANKAGSGDQELAAADQRLASVEPRIPYVAISFATTTVTDVTVVVDGKAYAKDTLAKIAVDPGEHVLVVSSPGFLPYETKFAMTEGEQRAVIVPALEKSVTVRSRRRTIGLITAGAGVVVGATGIVMGLVANSRYDATNCHPRGDAITCDTAEDFAASNKARSLGNVSTVVTIAGGAAIVVGGVLWFTARRSNGRSEQPRVTLLPQITPETAGITAVGRF